MGLIEVVCNWCSCQKETYANAPEPYKFDGTYTNPWSMAVTSLFTDFNPQCSTSISYIQGDYQNRLYFWYSANDAAGLLYRFSSSITPLSPNTLGTDINVAQIATSQGQYADASKYQLIQDLTYNGNSTSYLQYSLFKPDGWTENPTGGYVLSIKQTKCRSSDGIGMGSSYGNKGNVAYIIVPSGEDPNTSGNSYTPNVIQVDNNGLATITIPSGTQNSNVWMIIQNLPSDYQDSFGQYSVSISTNVPTGQFSVQILNPLFSKFKSNVRSTAETLFKNMTCYDGFSSQYFSCTNFFNYIKAMLILYIISYAAMFLLGMVEISQKDLVIRVVKIAIVSGLMSQGTFNLFNTYVFDLATGFSDQMIANMSGYSIFTNLGSIDNPFMFMDALMSKIFFSFTFLGQLLALLSMGISGILYFIIVLVALIILIIAVLRAIVVYIMAFLSVAILIGLAPLFITFMLFEATWYLFDNWVRFTFRYMVEPVVLMAGIIILTQLFTIYLDYVLGYSVCWKCALPFSIPFPSIPGFNPAFLHVDIFCINWFAPWGLDHRSGLMGINMQHMIALAMIAYCMHGYAELSSKMVTNITGATGPAATDTAGKMSRSYEQKALGKVGLDDKSRAQYKAGMKERLKNKEAALKAQDKRIRKEGSARNKSDDKAKGGAKDQVQTKS
jgi:type IV secretion system protein VirB6